MSARKATYFIAALVAVVLAGPMLPLELAVWFSGELLLYIEVVSTVWLTSRVTSVRASMQHLRRRSRDWLRGRGFDSYRIELSLRSWFYAVVTAS